MKDIYEGSWELEDKYELVYGEDEFLISLGETFEEFMANSKKAIEEHRKEENENKTK
jgi:predicted RNase H-like HicB family nuclease